VYRKKRGTANDERQYEKNPEPGNRPNSEFIDFVGQTSYF